MFTTEQEQVLFTLLRAFWNVANLKPYIKRNAYNRAKICFKVKKKTKKLKK